MAHSQNCVFGNYFIAKPAFWRKWRVIAESLYQLAEEGSGGLPAYLNSSGTYVSGGQKTQMKVFVQERIAPVLLATEKFKIATLDLSGHLALLDVLFKEAPRTRRLLNVCDTLKMEYGLNKDREILAMYKKIRALIPTRRPIKPL